MECILAESSAITSGRIAEFWSHPNQPCPLPFRLPARRWRSRTWRRSRRVSMPPRPTAPRVRKPCGPPYRTRCRPASAAAFFRGCRLCPSWTTPATTGRTTGPMGTSIILPAVEDVARLLHTSETMVNVLVGIFLLSLGVFPMWWSNFSERHGRRPVYIVSFSWFLAFSVGSAVAPSISALIVLRMLAGAGALAVQACGAATVADLYVPEERGAALGIFYLGPLLGPFLLPIIGGAVAQAWG